MIIDKDIDQITFKKTGHIEVRKIKEDGGNHREVVDPADDEHAASLGLTDICNERWSPELRQQVAAKKAEEAHEIQVAKEAEKVRQAKQESDKKAALRAEILEMEEEGLLVR